ncbi:DUF6531 domain-containing protein [Streptomyces sp. NPDC059072]|uniref:DUF6531 domain-containing protein n=1 Tax=Streptomyces sp. NPDC059072 TaxID=3346715 RepID=UPI0036C4120F
MPTLRDTPGGRAVRRVPIGDRTELLVDLASGEPVLRRLDLVVAGAGRHLRLVREYRGGSRADEGFGPGWSLSAGEGNTIDRFGEPVTVTDSRGRVTTLHRDGEGRITKLIDPTGAQAAAFAYDAAGLLVREWDAVGAVTDFGWDEGGRLVRITPPHDGPVDLAYGEGSAVVAVGWAGPDAPVRTGFAYEEGRTVVTGPTGRRTTHSFDAAGRQVAVTDPLGHTARQEWDAAGRPTRTADAAGGTLLRDYDEEGRPLSLRLPTSGVFAAVYADPTHPGLPSSLRDPAGHELLLERDASGRVVRTGVAGRETPLDTRAYDPVHGRITEFTDGNGATTAFRYDAAGHLTQVVPPAPLGTTAYRYDALSRITSVTAGDGRTTGHRYDAVGRTAEVVDEDTGETLVGLVHDGLGRPVRKSGPGWSYSFAWARTAGGDRLTSAVRRDDTGSQEIRAGYDAEGLITSLATPGGPVLYGHDAAGRPASVTTPAGSTALLAHDAAGRLTSVDFGPAVQEIAYDASGRRTALTVRNTAGEVLLSVEYGYNTGGGADCDVLRHTVVDGEFTGYGYDSLKRLVRAGAVEYAYDGANHLVRLGEIGFTLNGAGQVVRFGETTFEYDGAGNFTEEQNPTGSFTYSPTRQTLTGEFGGVRVVDIAYDGVGHETPRRITETTVDGRTVTHVLTHSHLGVVRVADDGVPTDFVRTPDGTLLAVLTADGRHYWAVTDQHGSVLALLDEQGSVAARYAYTPHGAVTATGPAAALNPFRYRGAYQLLRSAHVLDHHLYNGFWGRFTQPDPTGRQYAPYTFSDNDPLNSGTWTRGSFWSVLTRAGHEDVTDVFFPSPDGAGCAAGPEPLTGPFTGPGTSPDRPPLVAWDIPSRTV